MGGSLAEETYYGRNEYRTHPYLGVDSPGAGTVHTQQISAANGHLEASFQMPHIAWPSVAGWLMGLMSIPLPFIAAAATYTLSALPIALIRAHESRTEVEEQQGLLTQIREGVSFDGVDSHCPAPHCATPPSEWSVP